MTATNRSGQKAKRSSNRAAYVDICWNISRRRSVAIYWQRPACRSPCTSCPATIVCTREAVLNTRLNRTLSTTSNAIGFQPHFFFRVTPDCAGFPKRQLSEVIGAGCHRPDAFPVVQPTVSKHWREIDRSNGWSTNWWGKGCRSHYAGSRAQVPRRLILHIDLTVINDNIWLKYNLYGTHNT